MNTRKAFCKFAASTAVAVLLLGFNARPAHAGQLDFTLYNESGRSVYNLYVTPANEPWGRDVLGTGVLRDGQSTRITFPGEGPSSPCLWDVKVVYGSGASNENRFDLCRESRIYVR